MKRALIAAGLCIGLAACTTTDMGLATGNYGATIDQMKGHGSVTRAQDGRDRFRWVIPANAYDDVIPTEQHEEQREYMLASWIGSERICSDGWEVTSRSEVDSVLVYEGQCL